MERPNFWRLLLRSTVSIQSIVIGISGMAVSIFFRPGWTLSGEWVLVILLSGALIIGIVSSMLYKIWPLLSPGLPKIRRAQQSGSSADILLLLDPSDLFGADSLVSVYRQAGDFEELVGYGRVATIQQNRIIQVLIERMAPGVDAAYVDSLRAGNAATISSTLVKPTVPRSYVI